jgi:hypothetical protein
MRRAAVGVAGGGFGAGPEPFAGDWLIHEAQHGIVAVHEADERAPQRRAHDEGARAVDRIDDPAQARVFARATKLLADEPVVGPAVGQRTRDRPLGRTVGDGHRIEGAVPRLVGTAAPAGRRADGGSRKDRQRMRTIQQRLEARPDGLVAVSLLGASCFQYYRPYLTKL